MFKSKGSKKKEELEPYIEIRTGGDIWDLQAPTLELVEDAEDLKTFGPMVFTVSGNSEDAVVVLMNKEFLEKALSLLRRGR